MGVANTADGDGDKPQSAAGEASADKSHSAAELAQALHAYYRSLTNGNARSEGADGHGDDLAEGEGLRLGEPEFLKSSSRTRIARPPPGLTATPSAHGPLSPPSADQQPGPAEDEKAKVSVAHSTGTSSSPAISWRGSTLSQSVRPKPQSFRPKPGGRWVWVSSGPEGTAPAAKEEEQGADDKKPVNYGKLNPGIYDMFHTPVPPSTSSSCEGDEGGDHGGDQPGRDGTPCPQPQGETVVDTLYRLRADFSEAHIVHSSRKCRRNPRVIIRATCRESDDKEKQFNIVPPVSGISGISADRYGQFAAAGLDARFDAPATSMSPQPPRSPASAACRPASAIQHFGFPGCENYGNLPPHAAAQAHLPAGASAAGYSSYSGYDSSACSSWIPQELFHELRQQEDGASNAPTWQLGRSGKGGMKSTKAGMKGSDADRMGKSEFLVPGKGKDGSATAGAVGKGKGSVVTELGRATPSCASGSERREWESRDREDNYVYEDENNAGNYINDGQEKGESVLFTRLKELLVELASKRKEENNKNCPAGPH